MTSNVRSRPARGSSSFRPTPAVKANGMAKMVILDREHVRQIIRDRQRFGHDRHDEVWDGVYVMPPGPNNEHQGMVIEFCMVLRAVTRDADAGWILPGANVSDRRAGWEHDFRCPDVVVVLPGGIAVDCGTHFLGGPDFLIEIQSPGDETREKLPFYSKVGVRELLIVQRDSRELELFRHDGRELAPVVESVVRRQRWLRSEVVPLAFRRRIMRGVPRLEVTRTDGVHATWTV
jgi:Uma2 family endonuclease